MTQDQGFNGSESSLTDPPYDLYENPYLGRSVYRTDLRSQFFCPTVFQTCRQLQAESVELFRKEFFVIRLTTEVRKASDSERIQWRLQDLPLSYINPIMESRDDLQSMVSLEIDLRASPKPVAEEFLIDSPTRPQVQHVFVYEPAAFRRFILFALNIAPTRNLRLDLSFKFILYPRGHQCTARTITRCVGYLRDMRAVHIRRSPLCTAMVITIIRKAK